MESVLINVESKSDIAFLVSLAKKMGMSAKPLKKSQIEDRQFGQRIKSGLKSKTIKRTEVMKALGE